jgi:hypothetical protein
MGARRARASLKILRVPYRSPGPFLVDPATPGFKWSNLKAAAATKLTAGVCSLVPRLQHPVSHGSRNGSGHRSQPAIGIPVCAKQTLVNGLGHQR